MRNKQYLHTGLLFLLASITHLTIFCFDATYDKDNMTLMWFINSVIFLVASSIYFIIYINKNSNE